MILGRSEGYLTETLEEMATVAHQIGLQMNDTKTKYTINRQDKNKLKATALMGKKYEKVESFKYLGTVITSFNNIETEIKSKIAVGNKSYHTLKPVLIKRSISQSIKIRLYKTVIREIVTYRTETWTLTNTAEKMLMTWDRKILRKIYGPTNENGQWRIKTNSELLDKYKSLDIVTVIKIQRLEWLGHAIRMNETRSIKKIFEGKLEGRRDREQPRLRWTDDVDDLRKLDVKRWRGRASDREEWASIIREAKAKPKGP